MVNIEKLRNFLESDEKSLSLGMVPISKFEDILVKQFGFDELDLNGDETNGWQIEQKDGIPYLVLYIMGILFSQKIK